MHYNQVDWNTDALRTKFGKQKSIQAYIHYSVTCQAFESIFMK